jgi:hypothetical protein
MLYSRTYSTLLSAEYLSSIPNGVQRTHCDPCVEDETAQKQTGKG